MRSRERQRSGMRVTPHDRAMFSFWRFALLCVALCLGVVGSVLVSVGAAYAIVWSLHAGWDWLLGLVAS